MSPFSKGDPSGPTPGATSCMCFTLHKTIQSFGSSNDATFVQDKIKFPAVSPCCGCYMPYLPYLIFTFYYHCTKRTTLFPTPFRSAYSPDFSNLSLKCFLLREAFPGPLISVPQHNTVQKEHNASCLHLWNLLEATF